MARHHGGPVFKTPFAGLVKYLVARPLWTSSKKSLCLCISPIHYLPWRLVLSKLYGKRARSISSTFGSGWILHLRMQPCRRCYRIMAGRYPSGYRSWPTELVAPLVESFSKMKRHWQLTASRRTVFVLPRVGLRLVRYAWPATRTSGRGPDL